MKSEVGLPLAALLGALAVYFIGTATPNVLSGNVQLIDGVYLFAGGILMIAATIAADYGAFETSFKLMALAPPALFGAMMSIAFMLFDFASKSGDKTTTALGFALSGAVFIIAIFAKGRGWITFRPSGK